MKMRSSFLSKLVGWRFLTTAIVLFVILASGAVVYAYGVCPQCYDVAHGSSKTITAFGECRVVTNNSTAGDVLAVPIKTSYEWFRFRLVAGDKDPDGNYYYTGSGWTNHLQQDGVTVARCPTYDACPNLAGIQATVPEGYILDLTTNTCNLASNPSCTNTQYYYNGSCIDIDPNECSPGEITTICPQGSGHPASCFNPTPGIEQCP